MNIKSIEQFERINGWLYIRKNPEENQNLYEFTSMTGENNHSLSEADTLYKEYVKKGVRKKMKYEIKKSLILQLEMNEHELTMIDKGGMQLVEIKSRDNSYDDEDDYFIGNLMEDLKQCDKFYITVQIPNLSQFKANKKQAETHKKQWDEINERDSKQASSEAEKV